MSHSAYRPYQQRSDRPKPGSREVRPAALQALADVAEAAVVPLPRRLLLTACRRGEVAAAAKSLIDARPARACRASRFARAALHEPREKR
jgi:hypothetical protein